MPKGSSEGAKKGINIEAEDELLLLPLSLEWIKRQLKGGAAVKKDHRRDPKTTTWPARD